MAEQKNIKTVKACSAVYIIAVLLAFAVILILPQSREWFKSASGRLFGQGQLYAAG